MKKLNNNTYDGIQVEHLYNEGKYVATVYYDDYEQTYKIFYDRHYDYYEGQMDDDFRY